MDGDAALLELVLVAASTNSFSSRLHYRVTRKKRKKGNTQPRTLSELAES